MKHLKITLIAAIVAIFAAAPAAEAQFRFGVQVGMNVNSLHFDESMFNSDNSAGFNGGVMCEFTVPVIGVGVDLGARYVRRNSNWMAANHEVSNNRDYIEVPLNIKWKINIPVVNNIIRPYIFTGPSIAFLTSKTFVSDVIENRKFDSAWNFGAGVELFKHVQVGASYGLGMTNTMKMAGISNEANIGGKNNYWTITATYLF